MNKQDKVHTSRECRCTNLPTEWTALCALVFLLGLKHGFDADHLATIDGLTRFNTRQRRPFGRYCGALFSLGHGVVVLLIAAGVGVASERWDAPRVGRSVRRMDFDRFPDADRHRQSRMQY